MAFHRRDWWQKRGGIFQAGLVFEVAEVNGYSCRFLVDGIGAIVAKIHDSTRRETRE